MFTPTELKQIEETRRIFARHMNRQDLVNFIVTVYADGSGYLETDKFGVAYSFDSLRNLYGELESIDTLILAWCKTQDIDPEFVSNHGNMYRILTNPNYDSDLYIIPDTIETIREKWYKIEKVYTLASFIDDYVSACRVEFT